MAKTRKPLDLNSPPPSTKAVIRAVEELGLEEGWEQVRGNGYFYLIPPANDDQTPCESIYTPRLSDMTLGQWIEAFKGSTGRGDSLKAPERKVVGENTVTSSGVIRISLK